jgi:hypothetical protein
VRRYILRPGDLQRSALLFVDVQGTNLTLMAMFTGNPQEVLKAIADRHKMEPTGEPSLQNAIEMARGSMRCEIHVLKWRSCSSFPLQSSTHSFFPGNANHLWLTNDV